jgi:hypothetical protein
MSSEINPELFRNSLTVLLVETFERVAGIYLDKETSLFETLDGLGADEASRPIIPGGTSIAAHTEHIRFYLDVLIDYMQGRKSDKIDWRDSWKVQIVNDTEWRELRLRLHDSHRRVLDLIKECGNWNDERFLGGALGIAAHTAYHLGALRQISLAVKAS